MCHSGVSAMILSWSIRYLDTRERRFRDRRLWLNTADLDAATCKAVEATFDMSRSGKRAMLHFRNLFREGHATCASVGEGWCAFGVADYFEDENGHELSYQQIAVVLTGNPDAMLLPAGFRPHDIEFAIAEKAPIDPSRITLNPKQLRTLAYFSIAIRELQNASFYREGPGSLGGRPGSWVVNTAISWEEIGSFATIFRRLHLDGDEATLRDAVKVFCTVLSGQPVAKWVRAMADEYLASMDRPLDASPILPPLSLPFTRKLLLEVYYYTQIFHQPGDRRLREYSEYLGAIGGDKSLLVWLFLSELWSCAIELRNVGSVVAEFYDHYCRAHGLSTDALVSPAVIGVGFKTIETRAEHESRVLREKAEELAKSLWETAGHPHGGHAQYLTTALNQLKAAIGRS